MTSRARKMLDALEAGCGTRVELWSHAGGFYLTNNGAADLRKAGVGVTFVRGNTSAEDRYVLNDAGGAASPLSPEPMPACIVEHDGQMALVA